VSKLLDGFCVFHLADLCGIANKDEAGAKIACFTPAGETCPNGQHATPSPAAAGPMATELQQSPDGAGPAVILPGYCKRVILAGIKKLAAGGALNGGPR
jgi:hypothetical protein